MKKNYNLVAFTHSPREETFADILRKCFSYRKMFFPQKFLPFYPLINKNRCEHFYETVFNFTTTFTTFRHFRKIVLYSWFFSKLNGEQRTLERGNFILVLLYISLAATFREEPLHISFIIQLYSVAFISLYYSPSYIPNTPSSYQEY